MNSGSSQAPKVDANGSPHPPSLRRSNGEIDLDTIPDVIQWFIDHDQRVSVIKHPQVEEVFQWKQELSRTAGEGVFIFNRAEDRLAIGIIQAVGENATETDLHDWISQLLNALNIASKANEATTAAYKLDMQNQSIVKESEKIPTSRGRQDFLVNCWVETLCTAEARVLGWIYKELYGRPFAP